MVKSFRIFFIKTIGFKILIISLFFNFTKGLGQIATDNFENTTTLFSNTGGSYYSGNSAAGDRPATSPFAQSGTYGIGINNGTATLSTSDIDVAACSGVQLNFKLASFSMGSTGNGADAGDFVQVDISPDGGVTYYNTLVVNGNSNAYWAYSATGVASTPYDGNVTPVTFAPAGGGSRTTDGYSSITITGLPAVSNLRVRITMLNNAANERWVIDNFVLSGTCGTPSTITTGTVSSPPFALTDCTVTASGTVDFTSTGTYTAGNIYTAQLSDASGSFASAVNIGTLSSTSNSGTIAITIPAGTASGTGYLIRVVSSGPSVTGTSSAPFTVTLICSATTVTCNVNGAMSNGNASGCGDGAGTPCNLSAYSYFGTFCGPTASVSCSGCSATSISTQYILPAGCTANVIAEFKKRGSGCSNSGMDAGDVLSITSSGGIVVGQSASLTNPVSGCTSSTFATTFTTSTISNGCGNSDGVVTRTITGGQFQINLTSDRGDEIATFSVTITGACGTNCNLVLPIELIDFYASQDGDKNDLVWKVASEEKIVKYIVEKSEDGINFVELLRMNPFGSENTSTIYTGEDASPYSGITYYRLSTIEDDYSLKYYKTITTYH